MTEPAGWQQYAALLRELDRLRLEQEQRDRARADRAEVERVEAERTGRAEGGPGGPGGGVAGLRAELVRVEAALDDQAGQLDRLARLLRLRRPALTPAPAASARSAWGSAGRGPAADGPASGGSVADGPEPPGGAPSADPFVLLEQAVEQARRSADLANQAERQARRPRLLPALAAGPRNVLVYLVAALLGLAVQYPIVTGDPNDAPFAVVLVLVPAVTFGLGWLVITLFGRSRLVSAAERARVGAVAGADPRRRSVRTGLMICFLAFPALFAVLLVTGRLTR